MRQLRQVCTAVIAFIWPFTCWGQVAPKPRLLPTEFTARKVQGIQSKLLVQPSLENFKSDRAQRERQFAQIESLVTYFVIAQLDAEPAIEWWQLRDQLVRIFGAKFDLNTPDHFHEPPYVFRARRPRKEDPTVWAIAYQGDAFNGQGGMRVVVESYVVENGKARLAGRGGSEMEEYDFKAEEVLNLAANSTLVLTHGRLQWASGHEIPAKAVLYSVSPAGVKAIWSFASPALRVIGSEGTYFAIAYHDEKLHSQNLPSTVVDVYAVGGKDGIPYRSVQQVAAFPKQ